MSRALHHFVDLADLVDHLQIHVGKQRLRAVGESLLGIAMHFDNDARRADRDARSRQGYTSVAASEKNPVPSEQERITRGLSSLVPVRNISTSIVETGIQQSFDSGALTVQAIILIEPHAALFQTEGDMHRATIKVTGFAYDLSNHVVDGFEKTLNMNLRPETFERTLREDMKLRGNFHLKKSGIYNLRVVTLSTETGEIGTANEWIEIP